MYTSLFMGTYPGKRILRNVAKIKALDSDQTQKTEDTDNRVQGTQRGTARQEAITFGSSVGCAMKFWSQAR